uniref:Metallo-beta-lactamase domain-containing protein n=1 Tax=Aegilops tauschii TaxID=37682 RepID=M8CA86_AEGTA
MALSLRAAASLASPPSGARPGRRPASVVRAAASPAALDKRNRRREQNVSGEFFVDHRCIDCATCRWMAPEVFKRVDGMSAVAAQPSSEEERTKALQALLSCPTASIHTDKPAKDILQVQNTFPLPIDDDLPGVYLCGYHSESSYGATSYLIVHPEGNIMVDRWTNSNRIYCCSCSDNLLMFKSKVVDITADVEWKLTGSGPWNIGSDFELIHTPGHTEGSVCLLYKPLKALFTGDHVAKSEYSDELNLFRMYSKQSVNLQLDSMRKLLDLDFEWYLPGHGYRIRYEDVQAKNAAIESLLANYKN